MLTTNTPGWSERSEGARRRRNRRRSRTGVEEGNGVVPELHGNPARVTRRRRREDPGAAAGRGDLPMAAPSDGNRRREAELGFRRPHGKTKWRGGRETESGGDKGEEEELCEGGLLLLASTARQGVAGRAARRRIRSVGGTGEGDDRVVFARSPLETSLEITGRSFSLLFLFSFISFQYLM